jgi:hypothetical protein
MPVAAANSHSPAANASLLKVMILSLDEAAFVEALVDHMIPADELSPKGTDIAASCFRNSVSSRALLPCSFGNVAFEPESCL